MRRRQCSQQQLAAPISSVRQSAADTTPSLRQRLLDSNTRTLACAPLRPWPAFALAATMQEQLRDLLSEAGQPQPAALGAQPLCCTRQRWVMRWPGRLIQHHTPGGAQGAATAAAAGPPPAAHFAGRPLNALPSCRGVCLLRGPAHPHRAGPADRRRWRAQAATAAGAGSSDQGSRRGGTRCWRRVGAAGSTAGGHQPTWVLGWLCCCLPLCKLVRLLHHWPIANRSAAVLNCLLLDVQAGRARWLWRRFGGPKRRWASALIQRLRPD